MGQFKHWSFIESYHKQFKFTNQWNKWVAVYERLHVNLSRIWAMFWKRILITAQNCHDTNNTHQPQQHSFGFWYRTFTNSLHTREIPSAYQYCIIERKFKSIIKFVWNPLSGTLIQIGSSIMFTIITLLSHGKWTQQF